VTRKVSEAKFHIGAIESNIDTLTGTAVKVRAEDWNGVEGETSAYERANFAGDLAGMLDEAGQNSTEFASKMGLLSGFAANVGETPRGLKETAETIMGLEGYKQVIEGIERLVETLKRFRELEVLVSVLKQSLSGIEEKQEINNPYSMETEEEKHLGFELNWYAGYITGSAAQLVATKGIGKLAKSTSVYKKVRTMVKSTPPGRLASYVATKRARAKAKVAGQLARGTKYAGGKVIGGAKTVGSAVRTKELVKRAGVDTSKLSRRQASSLRYYLKRGNDDEVDEVRSVDDDEVGDRFSISDRCRSGSAVFGSAALLTTKECELDLEESREQEVLDAANKRNVEISEFNEQIEELSPIERRGITEIINNWEYGGELIINSFKYYELDDLVLPPRQIASTLLELRGKGVKVSNLDGLKSPQLGTARGHFEEVAYALKLEREGVDVKEVGKDLDDFRIKEVDISKPKDGKMGTTTEVRSTEADLVVGRGDIDSDGDEEVKIVEYKTNQWNNYKGKVREWEVDDQLEQLVRICRIVVKKWNEDTLIVYRTTAEEDNVPKRVVEKIEELQDRGYNIKVEYNSESSL
jgi:hypothetical protein